MIKLGRYELVKRLARGGMAELLLARQAGPEGFEKLLVIKRLLPSLADQEDIVRMFLNEARIAARLTHPNIVQIFDLGKTGSEYFIAMEYVNGRDLRAIQKSADKQEQPLPYELSSYVLTCVCRGLHHAHTLRDTSGSLLGLVHRDVSPHNVLLSFSGDVKLADFGIAKATALAAETQAGVLKGKFAYMSPEQIRGEELDARSDVFSAGILLHELVCWQRLFRRESDFATIRAVESEAVPPPSAIRDDVPDVLENVIMRALDRDRDLRYATAQEMQMDLETVISDLGWRCGPVELANFMTTLFWRRLPEQVAFPVAAARVGAPPSASPRSLLDRPIASPLRRADPKSRGGQPIAALEPLPSGGSLDQASVGSGQTAQSKHSVATLSDEAATSPRQATLQETTPDALADELPPSEDGPPTVIKPPDFDDLVYDEPPPLPSPDQPDQAPVALAATAPLPQPEAEVPSRLQIIEQAAQMHQPTESRNEYLAPAGHPAENERSLQVLLVLGIVVSLSLTVMILVLIAMSYLN